MMKSSKGAVYKRRQGILKAFEENHSMTVEELSDLFSVSEITIRRDLQEFEDDGILVRFYGGAKLIEGSLRSINSGYNSTPEKSNSQKKMIAKKGAELVNKYDTVFVNSGSTALELLSYVFDKNVTIITNNARVLDIENNSKSTVVLSGGEIFDKKKSLVGDFAIHTFSNVVAKICFLGVNGITSDGITTFALSETAVNNKILANTHGPRVILTEGHKVGKKHNFFTAPLSMITHLITDSSADPEVLKEIESNGVEVIVVG